MAVGTTLNITIFCQLLAIVIVARCCASALRGGVLKHNNGICNPK